MLDKTTFPKVQEALEKMAAGIDTLPSGITSIAIDGQTVPLAAVKTQVQAYAGVYANVGVTEIAHQQAMQTRNEQAPTIEAYLTNVTGAFMAALGPQSPLLGSLGVTPNKTRTPLTGEQIVERTAKSNATRKARGTLGKKQKSKIHGTPAPAGTPPQGTTTPHS